MPQQVYIDIPRGNLSINRIHRIIYQVSCIFSKTTDTELLSLDSLTIYTYCIAMDWVETENKTRKLKQIALLLRLTLLSRQRRLSHFMYAEVVFERGAG
ncbi:MAG: hypothetical protein M3M89_04570 [Thermoproteota archaeon]|nr:hypothetical protein [Thermoproteota archaeon]